MILIAIGVLALCGGVVPHTYHLGTCPIVEPMPGFEMNHVSTSCPLHFICDHFVIVLHIWLAMTWDQKSYLRTCFFFYKNNKLVFIVFYIRFNLL